MCENLRRLMVIEAKGNGVHYSEYVEQDMPGYGPPPPRNRSQGGLPNPKRRLSPREMRAAMKPKRARQPSKPSDNAPRSVR